MTTVDEKFGNYTVKVLKSDWWTTKQKLSTGKWLSNKHLEFLKEMNLSKDSTFLDIGANYGIATLALADRGFFKKSILFEPIKHVYDCMSFNVENVKNIIDIEVNNFGIFSENTDLSFFFDEKKSGCSHISHSSQGNYTITVKTLDSLELSDAVDLMKIDVEGVELAVLTGAAQTINKNRPIIVFEANVQDAQQLDKLEKVFEHFANIGYSIYNCYKVQFKTAAEYQIASQTAIRKYSNGVDLFAVPAEKTVQNSEQFDSQTAISECVDYFNKLNKDTVIQIINNRPYAPVPKNDQVYALYQRNKLKQDSEGNLSYKKSKSKTFLEQADNTLWWTYSLFLEHDPMPYYKTKDDLLAERLKRLSD